MNTLEWILIAFLILFGFEVLNDFIFRSKFLFEAKYRNNQLTRLNDLKFKQVHKSEPELKIAPNPWDNKRMPEKNEINQFSSELRGPSISPNILENDVDKVIGNIRPGKGISAYFKKDKT